MRRVKAIFVEYPYEDAKLAINPTEVETFALPEAGAVHWWRDPFRVRWVTPGDPPTVEMLHDDERERRYQFQPARRWKLEAGRASDKEHWHGTVYGPGGDVRGDADFCETGHEAAERAPPAADLPARAPSAP